MSVNLLRGAAAGKVSPELVTRPGKSNAFPMTVSVDGTVAGDSVQIEGSLTNQSLTDWETLFTLTVPAVGSTHNSITVPYERVRVTAWPGNTGLINCNLEPGA